MAVKKAPPGSARKGLRQLEPRQEGYQLARTTLLMHLPKAQRMHLRIDAVSVSICNAYKPITNLHRGSGAHAGERQSRGGVYKERRDDKGRVAVPVRDRRRGGDV